ncbi:MAG: DUF418 domain-containing protein [Xanthomonadaceae bacterium]|jgi:uncharacterized protein|nr:DUF418 domain-containing protein [Xanthomonadaceae bacterium]
MPSSSVFQPIAANERIVTLDVLRGFALLGILLMNIEAFVGPLNSVATGVDPQLEGLDRDVDALIYFFVQGKFYPLFSLLFGMGFALMAQRAVMAGRAFVPLYLRRSIVLLLIGGIHMCWIWAGDILMTYALLALLLLPLYRWPPLRLACLGVLACLLIPVMLLALGSVIAQAQVDPAFAARWDAQAMQYDDATAAILEAQRQAYGYGSYAEATWQRMRDGWQSLSLLPMTAPPIFGMFLLGAAFVKSGAIANPERFSGLYRTLRWLVLPLGAALMAASFQLAPSLGYLRIGWHVWTAIALGILGGSAMCLGYFAWAAWIIWKWPGKPWVKWLGSAGRMALSNYLLQSIVCTMIFYGYGLGFFERLSRFWQVPFVLLLFSIQVIVSHWWLRRFRFGPMEWLWRSLTYLKWQPLRRSA